MRKKLTSIVTVMVLSFAFVEAKSDNGGGLGSAYAQAQGVIKSNPVKPAERPSFISAEKTFSGKKLSVSGKNGDIMVRAGKPGEIRYQVSYCHSWHGWNFFGSSSCSDSGKSNPENRVDFFPAQDHVQFHTARYWSFKAVLWIPSNTRLSVDMASGDVNVGRRRGPLNITANSGDVRIESSAGPVSVRVGSGDVSITASKGPLNVEAGSGDVSIVGGALGVNIKTGSGNISVSGSGPKSRIKSGSGKITFSTSGLTASQCISARSGLGTLKVLRPWPICEASSVDLQTGSGAIIIK